MRASTCPLEHRLAARRTGRAWRCRSGIPIADRWQWCWHPYYRCTLPVRSWAGHCGDIADRGLQHIARLVAEVGVELRNVNGAAPGGCVGELGKATPICSPELPPLVTVGAELVDGLQVVSPLTSYWLAPLLLKFTELKSMESWKNGITLKLNQLTDWPPVTLEAMVSTVYVPLGSSLLTVSAWCQRSF